MWKPYSHCMISLVLSSHMVSNDSSKKYPDTIAVTYDDYNQKVRVKTHRFHSIRI